MDRLAISELHLFDKKSKLIPEWYEEDVVPWMNLRMMLLAWSRKGHADPLAFDNGFFLTDVTLDFCQSENFKIFGNKRRNIFLLHRISTSI